MIKVHVTGDYGHRQPLAYAALRALVADRIAPDEAFEDADLVVVAHPKDIAAHGAELKRRLGAGQRLVLLSEEPFWDTIWSADPFTRHQVHDTDAGPLPVTHLNHWTSTIYDFEALPYFPLTDRRYFNRYALRFARNAARSEADWRAHFDATSRVVFMAEKRRDAKFDRAFPARDVFGLSAARTRIALACEGPQVDRIGHGWSAGPRRQQSADWHLEKLAGLDGRCRIVSGIENTHARLYVTEKIFDAFAVGALPLYVAGPDHRVHDLVPGESFLNLYGLAPEAAAEAIAADPLDAARLEAWRAAQAALATLFGSGHALAEERARLGAALAAELEAAAEAPAP